MAKKFFIKSSKDLITLELEKLQNKVNFLEASTSEKVPKKRSKKVAVYSPPIEVDAKRVEFQFEADDETFK